MTRYIRASVLALSLLVMPLALSATAQTGGATPGQGGYGTGQPGSATTGQGQGYGAAGYDDGNDWGWLGLFGLLGLVGLLRRPQRTHDEQPHRSQPAANIR